MYKNESPRNYSRLLQESNFYINQIMVAHSKDDFVTFKRELLKLEIIIGSLKNDMEQRQDLNSDEVKSIEKDKK